MKGENRMNKCVLTLIAALAACLLLVGCGQAAPTTSPAASTRAAEPAKAAVSVSETDFPAKGRTIEFIVPWAAGGGTDVGARALAPALEKQLGVPVQVINKAGAASQTGLTELVRSKPDGYSIGYTNLPNTFGLYLDPDRKAAFGRKDFQPVALHISDAFTVAVANGSPFKTMKDLVDFAKANPEKVKVGTSGLMSFDHFNVLQVQKVAGIKFNLVHFDGAGPASTALLGGHVDAVVSSTGAILQLFRNNAIRVLGVMTTEESKFLPGVKTMQSQGYDLVSSALRGISVPAGTAKPIVDTLSDAVKKAMDTVEVKKQTDDLGLTLSYMDATQFSAFWDKFEKEMWPVIEEARGSSIIK